MTIAIFCLLFTAALLLGVTACSDTVPTQPQAPEEPSAPQEPTPEVPEEPAEPESWLWPVSDPAAQGFNADALPTIHDIYDSFPLLSAMIIKNGYVNRHLL